MILLNKFSLLIKPTSEYQRVSSSQKQNKRKPHLFVAERQKQLLWTVFHTIMNNISSVQKTNEIPVAVHCLVNKQCLLSYFSDTKKCLLWQNARTHLLLCLLGAALCKFTLWQRKQIQLFFRPRRHKNRNATKFVLSQKIFDHFSLLFRIESKTFLLSSRNEVKQGGFV